MKILPPSSIEECIKYMGEPQIILDVKDKSAKDVAELKAELIRKAENRGYRNLVLKTSGRRLYAF